jgi:hypothetical protein
MPIEADSGNGAYLFYRLDLANNEASTQLVRRCLQALAWHFDTASTADLYHTYRVPTGRNKRATKNTRHN